MLRLNNVTAHYETTGRVVKAVSEVDLTIGRSEVLGIAGESGSGKSSLLKVLYGAVEPPMHVSKGEYFLELKDGRTRFLTGINGESFRDWWWKHISYIPQSAMNVLNPVARVETQFLDALARITKDSKRESRRKVASYINQLELSTDVLRQYPHQLSGGMRQRVVIAMATFMQPEVVLADEPTTALDVVVQRGILTLLTRLQRQMQNTLVIVSHDMGVHYQVADRVAIMYSGRIVELARGDDLFKSPLHPYTKGLIDSLPVIGDSGRRRGITERYDDEKSAVTGCPFYGRCPARMEKCREIPPQVVEARTEHFVECHLFGGPKG